MGSVGEAVEKTSVFPLKIRVKEKQTTGGSREKTSNNNECRADK